MSFLNSLKSMLSPAPRLDPIEAAAQVRAGSAVLVDVREPAEWSQGVAERAVLLPLSDLVGPRREWRDFLAQAKGRKVLVYCASGMRSGRAARILRDEGLDAANTGGLADWATAGWPIVRPS